MKIIETKNEKMYEKHKITQKTKNCINWKRKNYKIFLKK